MLEIKTVEMAYAGRGPGLPCCCQQELPCAVCRMPEEHGDVELASWGIGRLFLCFGCCHASPGSRTAISFSVLLQQVPADVSVCCSCCWSNAPAVSELLLKGLQIMNCKGCGRNRPWDSRIQALLVTRRIVLYRPVM